MSLPNVTIILTGAAVAWYGAILSTITVFFLSLNYLRDRSVIKISLSSNYRAINADPIYPSGVDHILVEVINKGRRPIKISTVGLRILGDIKPWSLLSDSFSPHTRKLLTEEEPRGMYLVRQEGVNIDRIWFVQVTDATGKKYKRYLMRFPTFWRIKMQVRGIK